MAGNQLLFGVARFRDVTVLRGRMVERRYVVIRFNVDTRQVRIKGQLQNISSVGVKIAYRTRFARTGLATLIHCLLSRPLQNGSVQVQ